MGLIAGMRALSELSADALAYFLRVAKQGDLPVFDLGPSQAVLVNHPDLIRQVLVDDAPKYWKAAMTKRLLGKGIGNGLLVSDGDYWRRQRRLVQPAFHAKRIEAYADIMVAQTERMIEAWRPGLEIDADDAMMRLTLGIVAKTLFDTDLAGDIEQIAQAVGVAQDLMAKAFRSFIRPPDWLPTRDNRRAREAVRTLRTIGLRFVRERRASGEDKGDLLSMLALSTDEDGSRMTDEQACDEALTLLVAGHETTANALCWCWVLLDQNPAAAEALRAELAAVLGDRPPAFADLAHLPYLDAVIKETLRLYPVAWLFSRQPVEPVSIGGRAFPIGTRVMISPWVMHRDPRWFEEPEAFRPERWLDGLEKRLPRFAYIPFGGGPRICIGNSFALMEARLVAATIARRFRLAVAPGQRIATLPQITVQPKYGLRMIVGK